MVGTSSAKMRFALLPGHDDIVRFRARNHRLPSSLVLAAVAAEFFLAGDHLFNGNRFKCWWLDDPPFPFSSVRGKRLPDHAGSVGARGVLRHRQL